MLYTRTLSGNGRIGRILIPIFLYETSLLSKPTFYLSEYLDEHREEYIEHLHRLGQTRNSWRDWTVFFLEAIASQAERNAVKADKIMALYEDLKERFIQVTNSKYAIPLLDAVFELQYFNTGQLEWRGQAPSKPTLMTMLQSLESAQIISVYRYGAGRTPAIWWLPEIQQLLNQ